MKKALLARKFINENIKINAATSSYPLRTLTSNTKASEDIKPIINDKKDEAF